MSRSNKKAPPQRSLAFGIQNLPLPNPLNQTNDPSNHHRHFEKQPRAKNTMVRSTSNLRQRLALSLSGVGFFSHAPNSLRATSAILAISLVSATRIRLSSIISSANPPSLRLRS